MSFSLNVKNEIRSKERIETGSSSFLRDAFISYGTMTDPMKCYHLEFCVSEKNIAEHILYLLYEISNSEISAGISRRNNSYIVYIKACEGILDFLTYVGATKAAMDMMQIKMIKDVRNYANRTTNFETANLDKTVEAAGIHISAIKKIQSTIGIDSLPDVLREVARLRLENPDMSLKALGQSLSKTISRSGVNHRLEKIIQISKEC